MANRKLKAKLNKFLCDVLIIGNGSAGLRAAIEAHDCGANVVIVSKSKRGDSHTVLATGGINAALGTLDPKDNWKIHAADTLCEGQLLADHESIKAMCKNAPQAIRELIEWGARFQREPNGRLTQRFFGAHSYRRTCFYGDETGKEIIRILMNQVHERRIKIMDGVYIPKLLDSNGEIIGAVGIDIKRKRFVAFVSKCVILAGGGYSHVYTISSSRDFENYGEGVALAYDIGADLIDMEMVQYRPTGMVWPNRAVGKLATESIRGEGGILLNSESERFMNNYNPQKMELGPRDEVARAIYNEIMSGRETKHGGVWLDITKMPKKKILERLPRMYKQFRKLAGIDISKQKMEVAPTAHYSMGGVKVDNKCRTKIKGLFAVGEVTGQLHGANRLGGNSLLETMVFGRIAGREAAMYSKHRHRKFVRSSSLSSSSSSSSSSTTIPSPPSSSSLSDLNSLIVNNTFDNFFVVNNANKIVHKIQKLMQENAGIIRDAGKLENALEEILELKDMYFAKNRKKANARLRKKKMMILSSSSLPKKINNSLVATLDLKSCLIVCEAIIRSALMRRESRGAHYRSDFPNRDDKNWLVNIHCVKDKKGVIRLFTRKVKERKKLLKCPHRTNKAEHHLLE